jgi:AraC-like DNA-binding protein
MPWGSDPEAFWQKLQQKLPSDALVLGILHLANPRADEVLLTRGWPASEVQSILEADLGGKQLIKAATEHGIAAATVGQADLTPIRLKKHHTLIVMQPESARKDRWWWWMLGRRGRPFNDEEQRVATLLLRQWQVSYHAASEPGMGRVLLGHDDQVILADLSTQLAALHEPALLQELPQNLRPIVAQRFPNLPPLTSRDAAISLAGHSYWVRFHQDRPLGIPESEHWFVELRPLQDEELPVVGHVADDRIARAIAFLHEHYPDSPSLTQLARHVHMSPFHFHRLFSRQTGISPKHYLQKKQLQVAKWLLRSTKEPIGAIAAHTGFASHGHFTSTFHRLVGISPSDYRQRP